MRDSRRDFVFALVGVGGCLALRPGLLAAQSKWPKPPESAQPREQDTVDLQPSSKALRAMNGKEIKRNVQQLYDLVSTMKSEMDLVDPAEVFSVRLFKMAGQIEKLAKQIKNRARG